MRSGGGIKWAVKMSGGVGVAPQRGSMAINNEGLTTVLCSQVLRRVRDPESVEGLQEGVELRRSEGG
jgi:hypothetical protein